MSESPRGQRPRRSPVLTPRARKLVLTAHVTASVGWLGAVGCFLALATVGSTSADDRLVRATYLVLEPIGWYVIVPLSLASLVSGVAQALGSPWGLVRHYWVLGKLVINVVAAVLLVVHMRPIGHLADAAAVSTMTGGDLDGLRLQVTADAAAALVALLAATALSVFKPRGRTRSRTARRSTAAP